MGKPKKLNILYSCHLQLVLMGYGDGKLRKQVDLGQFLFLRPQKASKTHRHRTALESLKDILC